MSVIFRNVGFEWPDGQVVFHNLNINFRHRISGLVGPNGSGKSTLANLMHGQLQPTEGQVQRSSSVGILQQMEEPPECTVFEYWASSNDAESFAHSPFLEEIGPEQSCKSLSGGEWIRLRLAKIFASSSSFLVLDEPTNHLDREGRRAVFEFIRLYPGQILLISHDRELLERADVILELSNQGLDHFEGGWSHYDQARHNERERLQRKVEIARKERERHQRDRREKLEKQAKRQARGRQQAEKGGLPKILLGARKRKAEATQGRIEAATSESVESAVTTAWQAFQNLKIDPVMFAEISCADIPAGKVLLEARQFNFRFENEPDDLWNVDLNFCLRGRVRVSIEGANGAGKTTLLHLLRGSIPGTSRGELKMASVPRAFLNQNFSQLNPEMTIYDHVREVFSGPDAELNNRLAAFLFKGPMVRKKIRDLSGGEKLRAALALALLSNPQPQCLILDEPTNHLDVANIEFLENFLRSFPGAVVVVSHDFYFLKRLDLDERIFLESKRKKS